MPPLARLRNAAKSALFQLSRLDFLSSSYRQTRLLVLCYHGVISSPHNADRFGYHNSVTPQEFSDHIQYLGRRYQLIDLARLDRWLEGDWTGKPPALITFDDGYRNNLTLAAPILKRLGAPAVFFLTTGHIGRSGLLWTEECVQRVLSSPAARIPEIDNLPASIIPEPLEQRRRLAVQLRESLKRLPNPHRLAALDQLAASTNLHPSSIDHELNDFLSWEEARSLAALGFDIGSHTVSHPILSRLSPPELARELSESRLELERQLSVPVTSIAFPNGGPEDYSQLVLDSTSQAGYRFGFTVADRFHSRAGSRFAIARIGVSGHLSPLAFSFYASGLRDRLMHRQSRLS